MTNEYGIAGNSAPEFRFDRWLHNTDDKALRLADVAEPVVYLYNFQSWCPGCHSHGFPTMKKIKDHFEAVGRGDRIKFVAVQTVFEGHDANTEEAAIEALERHGLTDIALGHDSGSDSSEPPTIMVDYRTGGTPWTVILGPMPGSASGSQKRTVLAEGFQLDADVAITSLGRLIDELDAAVATHNPNNHNDRNENNMSADTSSNTNTSTNKPSDADLRERLSPMQYQVTQHDGTEPAFTGEYHDTKTAGMYRCVVCDAELFDSEAKYDSGSGWPSFHSAADNGQVRRLEDRTHGMVRVEARCASCDAHLGHVFPDGPRPTGERYCMNSASLRLEPVDAE